MIGIGIIGLGEAGELHLSNTAAPKIIPEAPPSGLMAKGRRMAGRLLHGPTPPPAPPRLISGTKLVAVSDVSQERVNWANSHFEIPYSTTNYKELIARKDVDAVLICTPPMFHAEITAEAARRGKHVFCEKPMALTSKDCKEMLELIEKTGITFQVGYMLRYSPEREPIAAAIRSNQIGRPLFYREFFHLSNGGGQTWIHDERTGGGPLFENSHPIDFARYALGDPESVFGVGGHFKPNKTSAFDSYAVFLMYPSGDRALIGESYALKNFGWDQLGCRLLRNEIDIAGPGGFIQYPDKDQSWNLTITTYGEPQDNVQKFKWRNFWGADGYRTELEQFIECIEQKKTPRVNGQVALGTVRLCETILRSIQTGQVCKFEALAGETAAA